MTDLTWHTGLSGDDLNIKIDWFNENGVSQLSKITITVQKQDKPRQLEIKVNDVVIAVIPNKE